MPLASPFCLFLLAPLTFLIRLLKLSFVIALTNCIDGERTLHLLSYAYHVRPLTSRLWFLPSRFALRFILFSVAFDF
jgi:hypothetical protein